MYNATLPGTEPVPLPLVAEGAAGGEYSTVPRRDIRSVAEGVLAPDSLLPRQVFLTQLQRERRRADRSGAPLSIAVFRPEASRTDAPEAGNDLVRALLDSKREADLAGSLGHARIAVLLVDTDLPGAQAFVRKIAARVGDLPFEVATGTYPGQMFEAVMGGKPEPAEFRSIFVEEAAPRFSGGYRVKRALDVAGALVGILLTSPLMIATAIAVRASSRGPVIFRQERLGLHGRPFVFYKFRSMYCNNDDSIHREFVNSLIQGEHEAVNQGDAQKPTYKLKQDPRVTRVGHLIRRTSIDELPQLFNVLKGDMSLVGPRPPLAYEVEKYRSWHLRRVLEVRPGITGLWQVEGRSRTTFDEMVRMDLRYVRTCSFAWDLIILTRTVTAVLRRDGAT